MIQQNLKILIHYVQLLLNYITKVVHFLLKKIQNSASSYKEKGLHFEALLKFKEN
ncbi:hypothetical protein HMPREF9444_02003 [Succinatimonas hippei YIT 12066]|uniref:Uncharacterized protein n=1 Tax=Succinatimonas hippei (strain DSM 22608 / JCM 16073 / KCTC 15190 / YIT 12066) TaxID=762983 RepID=E8LML0_SUCHY|nr:hypothetical protein HMPREF9444_02003 [Succinatimonas hippei YIT 12066]